MGNGERDDSRLLADHLAGDPDAFTQLVRRHSGRLWAVALGTLGDREEAADALQDALISALRAAAGYRGDAAVSTWLHRIVVNACLDRMRRRRARPAVPLGERDPLLQRDDHAATVARLDVHAALARLPEPQRVALVLVDLEDLPVSEVAALLGVAEGTVKSRCSRARTALASMLREEANGPDGGAAANGGGPNRPGRPGNSGNQPGNQLGPGRVQGPDEAPPNRPVRPAPPTYNQTYNQQFHGDERPWESVGPRVPRAEPDRPDEPDPEAPTHFRPAPGRGGPAGRGRRGEEW